MNTPHSPVPSRPGASAATTSADAKARRPVTAKEKPPLPLARSSTYLAVAHPTFRFITLFALPFALMLSGCATLRRHHEAMKAPPPPSTFAPTPVAELPPLDPALLQRPNNEYRLGPGDVLDIEVLGDINTRQRATVGPDGKIYFYILPGIDVWGMTIPQARDRVVQEMKKFVRDEQPVAITLRAAESQHIWVLGRLNRPGVYPLTGSMTLLEAISEAGGPAASMAVATVGGPTIGLGNNSRGSAGEAADLSRAFVVRQGRMLRIDFQKLLRDGDTGQNIYLQPDDLVYLPSAQIGSVHVLGAVNTPRAVDYASNLTLSQAIGEAGGMLMKNAYLSNVAIVRGSLSQPRIAVVDFNAILHGQAPDLALEPQDIVYVPYTPYRVLTRYVDLILDTFARTVGVNEGAKAISNNIQPLGVTVPLGGR
jgi:protein involved in polysaccharide export with SLBB domain